MSNQKNGLCVLTLNCQSLNAKFNQIRIMNKFAPTYLCSVSQKLNSLVSDLLNCISSTLRSSEYHLQVSFGPSGEATVIGLLWPTFVKQFNLLAFGSVDKAETKLIKQNLLWMPLNLRMIKREEQKCI